MRKLLLLTGAAALAIAMPAAAEKGGKGGGKAQGGGAAAAQVHKGGGAKAQGGGMKAAKSVHAGRAAKAHKAPKVQRQVHAEKPTRVTRFGKPPKAAKVDRDAMRNEVKRQERLARDASQGNPFAVGGVDNRFTAFGQACPPGLAKKTPACLPPGQAKKLGLGDRVQPSWFQQNQIPAWYSGFYPDTVNYFYRYDDNGYVYRIDRDSGLIEAIVPLFGGGFAVGQPLPAGYDVYNVPIQYRDVYRDSDDYLYRYGDNAIYRVDAGTGLIESVVALLTGDLMVGRPLPTGYDVYNVPMAYRDRYYDTDDSLYRYADGSIYQVDPQTMLIQAIVEMLI